MTVHIDTIKFDTEGHGDIVDITGHIADCIKRSGVSNGIASVFIAGSTGALTTTEFEPGAIKDFREYFDREIPPTPPGPPWGAVSYTHLTLPTKRIV